MNKKVLLGALVSLVVVAIAFLLVNRRVLPSTTRETVIRAKQSSPTSGVPEGNQTAELTGTPNAGTPEGDWRDEKLWEKTPEYGAVTNELYRIALAGDASHNLTPDEVQALILNIQSPHYEARILAVIATGDDKYPAPVKSKLLPDVLGLLHDPVSGVRFWAVWSLERIGDKSVIPHLKLLLSDDRQVVARAAQRAISKLEDKETAPGK